MSDLNAPSASRSTLIGVACASQAFLIWGLSPIYWKCLRDVPAFEILMHRIIWSFVFLLPVLAAQRRWGEFLSALRSPRTLALLLTTTLIVAFNWFLFIWSINSDHVLQTSLGYYINPLVNVFLGMLILKERLRPLQKLAVVLAGVGVTYFTCRLGEFPWVALALAFSFGFYGLLRKMAPVSSPVGLCVETLLLSIPAVTYLVYLDRMGVGAFLHVNARTDLMLMGAALVTGLPLLLFTMGARRLHLSTIGFLQYIAPSGTFLLAVFVFHEPLVRAQLVTFVLIWAALGIFSADSVLHYRGALRRGRLDAEHQQ